MRFQGRITDWNGDRGFGFITPNGGGARVFLHFRAMQNGEPRPAAGGLVTYEVLPVPGKGPRAENVAYAEQPRTARAPRAATGASRNRNRRGARSVIAIGLLIALGAYGWQRYTARRHVIQETPAAEVHVMPASPASSRLLADQLAPGSGASAFRCEGKTTCTQMTSCEEAKFYLKNCPGVTIDGDGDGIPCERQWCK